MTATERPGRGWSARRIWTAIGGLVGLCTIIGVAVAVISILQGRSALESQDTAQATMIAIEGEQLVVQQAIATFQASDIRTGPTATAIAASVVQLMSTQEALEAERRRIEATLTAVPGQATGPTSSNTLPMQVSSQLPGISVELLDLSRFENTITIKLRFVNSGQEDQEIWLTNGSYLRDDATGKRYSATDHSNQLTEVVPGQGSFEGVWATYLLREGEVPRSVTVVLRYGILFEHMEIPR